MYTLLIADDFRFDREKAATCLNWAEMDIELLAQFSDGVQVLEYLADHPVDFILTDVEMPHLDGIALARQIVAMGYNTDVAFMSCHADTRYLQEAIDLHAGAYIIKPVEKEEMLRLFDGMIANRMEKRKNARILEESRPLLIDQFLYKLCGGLFESEKDVMDMLTLIRDPKREPVGGAYLPILIGCAAQTWKPEQTFEQTMWGVRMRTFCREQNISLCGQADGARYIILLEGAAAALNDYAQRFLADAHEAFNETIQAACGPICEHIQDIAQAYTEMRQTYWQALAGGKVRPEVSYGLKLQPGIISEQLRVNLLLGDETRLKRFADSILEEIRRIPGDAMRLFARRTLVVALGVALDELGLSLEMLAYEDAALWGSDAQDETAAWLYTLLETTHAMVRIERTGHDGEGQAELIDKVVRYIQAHLAEDITVRQIAADHFFSPNYLNTLFRRIIGKTIPEYLLAQRLERAKQLLKAKTMNVGEVMRQVGYHKASYFNKIFRESVGLTPQQFRSLS